MSSARGSFIIFYLYPKNTTKDCTIEAVGFRDYYEKIRSLRAIVVGVSGNSIESVGRFAEK